MPCFSTLSILFKLVQLYCLPHKSANPSNFKTLGKLVEIQQQRLDLVKEFEFISKTICCFILQIFSIFRTKHNVIDEFLKRKDVLFTALQQINVKFCIFSNAHNLLRKKIEFLLLVFYFFEEIIFI